MTRARLLGEILLLTLIMASVALAGGFQLNEHGANAMAQAGAFAARATDGSAIYFNPAGLGFQTTPSIMLGATGIAFTSSFYGPLQANTNQKYEQAKQIFTPVNGYVVYPVMDRLTVGAGVNNQYGLGTEWPSTWPGRFLAEKTDLATWFITPSVAYRVSDQLSIAVEGSYVAGTVKLTRGVDTRGIQTPAPVNSTLDMKGHGFAFGGGVLYKPTPELSIGVSYRSKVKVDASGTATFTPNYTQLGLPQGGVSASITLPATGFAGIAYKITKDLEVEADYQYIGWSSYKTLSFTFASNNSVVSSTKNYSDTYILRVGGEYTMAPWHFRAGYLYDHCPVSDTYAEPMLPDANRNGLNVGLGYDVSQHWNVSVAYFFLKFNDRTVQTTAPEISFDGTYHTYANLFGADIEFKF
ncbi:MAG TPA: outer membrane protein transport protein [Bacteroidota bacterium]|nr:outer membrane protein transport protein [Bacteroidota bacterium]